MLRLATDADVHGDIVRGLLRAAPELDLVRVQDVGLREAADPDILEWSAAEERVLITQDVNTMVGFALERVRAGRPMPGVIAVLPEAAIGRAIDDILLVEDCYGEEDMRGRVEYVPFPRP